jgi:hypothetical protein
MEAGQAGGLDLHPRYTPGAIALLKVMYI